MHANLRIVGPSETPQKPEVAGNAGRKSDAAYGRADHKFLTEAQVLALIKAAEQGRYGKRDALMILMAYRHALRVSELVNLKWSMVDLEERELHVKRGKGGRNKRQAISPDCRSRLRKLFDETNPRPDDFLFMSERGDKVSTDAFASQLRAAGKRAGFEGDLLQLCHPHALRHACGAEMARRGIEGYEIAAHMGHRKLETTTIYLDGIAGQDSWSKGR
jgi:type 1 fimbriae regulatory protein FimB/type 1 fimbriae regulatory protein FimE